jgi:2-succinyl-5-enolpyruvyl-6-hydroxy-3-cyclohexene-1-carboxylate synthase
MGKAPQLGFGIMRLPQSNGKIDWITTEEIIDEYMKDDFCYFDLHPSYMYNQAQDIFRELVVKKYLRESYYIANKMPYYGIKNYRDYELIFAKELETCGVEWFDYYMLHAVTREVFEMHEQLGGFNFLKEKKEQKKIKYIGFSFHDKPELLEEILKIHPELDFVQLQINYLDWEDSVICSRRCYEIARKYNKRIMIMEPIKGGALADQLELDGLVLTPEKLAKLSLEFVAGLPGIDVALSGMSNKNQVRENRKTLSEPCKTTNIDIYQKLRNLINSENKIPCTVCRYCVRECPVNINIPDIISMINSNKNLPDNKNFMGSASIYRSVVHGKGKAGDCVSCGKCERRCPQKLKIRTYMKEAASMFEEYTSNNINYYTSERNTQILIYLLKAHGIKKVLVSPGATNVNFVYSIQQDSFFEIYSVADERSAAYIACGFAEESGEPIALSCTGATASRNYLPALTEAYYRKLPVLAITSAQQEGRIGHNIPQVIDRTTILNDIAKISVNIPTVKDVEDEWVCETRINKALLELKHRGYGPVHINLTTSYSTDFSVRNLPAARVIKRILERDVFPELPAGKIGIFCGAYSKWGDELIEKVDDFCKQHNAVVICDHTSNYKGKYGVLASLVLAQEKQNTILNDFILIVHIGNVSGAYLNLNAQEVWRVNSDGEVCDTFRKLKYVFEMEEISFFERYVSNDSLENEECSQEKEWKAEYSRIYQKMPELPFSNAWVAQKTADILPANSVLHLGILNSLRCWNFFRVPKNVAVYSNTGGFGIDGCISTLLGASLADPDKLYYGVVGDLAFFYDMNVLGNRHLGSNLRLILINNGCGTEFKNYNHMASRFSDETDAYIAAAGHYGNKSGLLVKNYAENLGFEYRSIFSKEDYLNILPELVSGKILEKSLLIEVFTNSDDESRSLKIINTLDGEKEIDHNTDKKVSEPSRMLQIKDKKKVVLWGTGYNFSKNLSEVEQHCNIQYVCDNNSVKWGKEIVSGIKCISPNELEKMENIFVVIMMEDARIAFQIANQLLDMGINSFDLVYNWLLYVNDERYV